MACPIVISSVYNVQSTQVHFRLAHKRNNNVPSSVLLAPEVRSAPKGLKVGGEVVYFTVQYVPAMPVPMLHTVQYLRLVVGLEFVQLVLHDLLAQAADRHVLRRVHIGVVRDLREKLVVLACHDQLEQTLLRAQEAHAALHLAQGEQRLEQRGHAGHEDHELLGALAI